MSNTKKKDNSLLQLKSKVSLKDTIADVLSSELQLLEEKSLRYHPKDSIQENVRKLCDEFELKGEQKATGVIKFSIPSEKVGQKNATVISDNKAPAKVDIDDLPGIINTNKNINKVIIEEINLNDVKRTQLHFDKKNSPINERIESKQVHNDDTTAHSSQQIQTSQEKETITFKSSKISSKDFEKKINDDFMSGNKKVKKTETFLFDKQSVKNEKKEEAIAEFTDIEVQDKEVKNENKSGFNFTLKDNNNNIVIDDKKINVKSKSEKSNVLSFSKSNDSSFEASKKEYRRKKDNAAKSIANLYYKTKKHNELFKLGTLFYRDLESGLKSFAFTGQGDIVPQQSTILGLSAYFSYHMKITTTVFTESFKYSKYNCSDKEIATDEIMVTPDLSIKVNCYQDLRVIEYCELQKIIEFADVNLLEDTLESIIDNNELIFWDLPTPKEMEKATELYFPITRIIDNVSLIVKPNNSKIKSILDLKEYFEKYHIQIKGMIMSDQAEEKNTK